VALVIHMRIVSPPDRTERVLALLEQDEAVCNIVTLRGAAAHPEGDVVMADVAREDASIVVSDLKHLGIHEDGSIALEHIDTAIGRAAARAAARAEGEEADAVVWEQVEDTTSEEATLSWAFLAFMVLAAGIAVSGIFTNSAILIVGAMVVSPDFGPLAGVCVGLVQRRRRLALRSLVALVVGFACAIAVAYMLAELLIATQAAPDRFSADSGIAHLISSPDAFTFIVAFCAGVAGMLSLSTAKSGALIGVLISVTTIPAAAEIGVAGATGEFDTAAGAAAQLVANITTIVVAGALTLALQRFAYYRRRRRHVARLRADGLGCASASSRATPRPRASSRPGSRPRS